jgi:hypothetical protein
MASSSDQITTNGHEGTVDFESLVVIDEINDTSTTEQSVVNSDDEIQIIAEVHKSVTTKNHKRTLDTKSEFISASSSTDAKRQKIDEVLVTSTSVQEVEINEPQSSDSPDIAENEVDFVYNARTEEHFLTAKKRRNNSRYGCFKM